MFIAIEGIDTSGKSTQINLLKQTFPNALFTKEPGGTPLGQTLREKILDHKLSSHAQFLLFLADRSLHIEEVIKPNSDRLIFSDRSLISGLAYAPYLLQEAIDLHKMHGLLEVMPDLVFVLKLDHVELKKRLDKKTSMDCIESQGVAFLEHTQKRLLEACQMLKLKTYVLDASKSPSSIHKNILEKLESHLEVFKHNKLA
ncbi:dTMP kinase [Helicobacter suis]|uniref:dTMP kinase n=1 Tax=Helicobacter suis TaxID=104628 RepID=UPI001F078FF6|nr:dTMP kinase [Helicobacter suis]